MSNSIILTLKNINKSFGDFKALKNVSLNIKQKQIHAILGENGAGKSTLMSIISGNILPDSGEILIKNKKILFTNPAHAQKYGIGMVHQKFMLIENFTVWQNIALGTLENNFVWNKKQIITRINSILCQFNLNINPEERIHNLSMGQKQQVEILKLLYKNSKILIFDEPTSVLTPQEIKPFFKILLSLRQNGHTILFISHKLEEVLEIADTITVMQKGKIVSTTPKTKIKSKLELASLMIGKEFNIINNFDTHKTKNINKKSILQLNNIQVNQNGQVLLKNINLKLKQGEIFVLLGISGNGQEVLAKVLGGLQEFKGEIIFDKKYNASQWINNYPTKIVYIPEDRNNLACIEEKSLYFNFVLTRLKELSNSLKIKWKIAKTFTQKIIQEFNIKTPNGINSTPSNLSGGNLQKFILGRELSKEPTVIVAEHPTQGLDINSTQEIWKQLIQIKKHSSILLISGDIQESLILADRIGIIYKGQIVKTFSPTASKDIANLGLYMTGSLKC